MDGYKKLLLLLICSLTCQFSAKGQSGNGVYYFRNMAVEDGLSQNMVYSIIQDNSGFIWLGTIDGLNRFDGINFKIYKRDDSVDGSIGSNKILSLLQVDNDHIWVGTANGIYIHDLNLEKFTRFEEKTGEGKMVEGIIRDIKADREGNIWIAAQEKGVFLYTRDGKLKLCDIHDANARKIDFDSKGNIWVATHGGGILRIHPQTGAISRFLLDSETKNRSDNDVNIILPLNSSRLLIGTSNKGVLQFDLTRERFMPFLEKGGNGTPLYVRSLMKTETQELWIGTEEGIYIHDLKTNRCHNIRHRHNDPYSLSDNAIHSLYQDREGGIWVGTFFGGVNYFHPAFTQFRKYYPISGQNSISGKSISEFCEDEQNNLWIGTEDEGLNHLDLTTGRFSRSSIPAKNIHSLLYDNRKLWVGTFSEGLYVMDLPTRSYKNYTNSTHNLKDDNIYSIYKDGSGRIWLGSSTGLQFYEPSTDNFIRVREEIIRNQVNDITEDHNGILWFATIGDGIYSYDRFTERWRHYLIPSAHGVNDTGRSIICILKDKKNRLWVGTEGAGVAIYDKASDSFRNVATAREGLPNEVIYRLIEDSRGYIWGSTNKGIFMLVPETMKITSYFHSKGLLGDQFNYKSGYMDKNGTIYFGGVKGFVAFNPVELETNGIIPPIVLTNFQIWNSQVPIGTTHSPLKQSITRTSRITLPHNISVFSISFAALSYVYPKGNLYAYKLEGRDDEWIQVKQIQPEHNVNYSDLPPGNYTFLVKGANSDGIWNETAATLSIKILPPWYRTIWAYILYFTLVSTIITLTICHFLRKARKRNEQALKELENTKEKELLASKIEFFTHITHEIRTPLSLIKIPIEDIFSKIGQDNPYLENLTIVQRNVNRLLKLVNELLDFRKSESKSLRLNFIRVDVVQVLEEIIDIFRPSFELKQITLTTNYSSSSHLADIDREVFIKIISNLLSNSLKYSASIVILELQHSDDHFRIIVENDGNTIPDEYLDKIFEPLFKLNHNKKGTGLGLAFVKSLVELHKGSIYCDNSKEKRTIFVLTLPNHQERTLLINENETAEEGKAELCLHPLPSDEKKRSTIVTIEDNRDFQHLLYNQLSPRYNLIQCGNGMEALEILEKHHVDMVITDIMMPVMDGLELCQAIKDNIKFSHIPVILLTAKHALEARIEGINTGADEYIVKPYSTEYLLARIENLLENRRRMIELFRKSPEMAFKDISHSKADELFMQKIIDIIHENISDPDLNIDKIAEEAAVSRSTLYRKVRVISELTPNEFITLIRLKKAAELIRERQYQISEIAYMVGFSSPNYFSKCFYKQFGILPKDF